MGFDNTSYKIFKSLCHKGDELKRCFFALSPNKTLYKTESLSNLAKSIVIDYLKRDIQDDSYLENFINIGSQVLFDMPEDDLELSNDGVSRPLSNEQKSEFNTHLTMLIQECYYLNSKISRKYTGLENYLIH